MKGKRFLSLTMAFCFVLIFCFSTAVSSFAAGSQFASGNGTKTNPWHIKTAAQFNNVRKHLNGNFVLDNNIDLKNYKNFQPIGVYTKGTGGDEEQANPKTAFTGTFDGNGKTIKNVSISTQTPYSAGLFGTISGSSIIRNLNVENVNVKGTMGVGGVVGLASSNALIDGVKLVGNSNKVAGNHLVGGLIGSANNKLVRNCTAKADVTITADNGYQAAGVLMGGDEGASLENCHALGGSVTSNGKASNNTGMNGLGGLAGCAMSVPSVLRCTAKNITIKAHDYDMLIGGLLGFSGLAKGSTLIKDCIVDNVTIDAPATAERIGGIVGGGYYTTMYKQYYAVPTTFTVENCYVTAKITNGRVVGSIAGYVSENSRINRCAADVQYKGVKLVPQIGGSTQTLPISQVGGAAAQQA